MPVWLQSLLALLAAIVLLPLVVWGARRAGRGVKGGLMLAGLMMGLGAVLDPPSKHMVEASDGETRDTPSPGDPPTPLA